MKAVVCDCSITAAWCLRDESNAAADRLRERVPELELLVPGLWAAEMANVLWAAERRGRMTARDAEAALAALRRLPLRVTPVDAALPVRLLATARAYELSAYDASYLELALHEGVPLATLDTRLLAAASAAGVVTLP